MPDTAARLAVLSVHKIPLTCFGQLDGLMEELVKRSEFAAMCITKVCLFQNV